MRSSDRLAAGAGLAAGLLGPAVLTAAVAPIGASHWRDYVYLYLGLVAVLGIGGGFAPAILAAAVSFLCVDFFLVPPVGTLTIADEEDLVNLCVFVGAVGAAGSRRRRLQMRAEALARELRRANDELARLNREQAEAAAVAVRLARTEQQVRVLEESDRVRREFLANVSHELRTPLGSILTNSTGLLARADLNSEVHVEAESIAAEARRLNRLVDMLDMARIEGNALDLRLQSVDLAAAVEAAVDRLHVGSPARPVTWVEDVPETHVVADWDRLGQVLDNLLLNADRAAPAGTPVTIHASRGARGMIRRPRRRPRAGNPPGAAGPAALPLRPGTGRRGRWRRSGAGHRPRHRRGPRGAGLAGGHLRRGRGGARLQPARRASGRVIRDSGARSRAVEPALVTSRPAAPEPPLRRHEQSSAAVSRSVSR